MAGKKKASRTAGNEIRLSGRPSERQSLFFASTARYTAYGGARGGGKSWALRRKLILLCLNYPGIRVLLVRRSLPELKENHLYPLLAELGSFVCYKDGQKSFLFPNGSRILLGYMDSQRDVLRYQGQEFDIIALDEATQLTEFQFSTLKACLRGANSFPKRMYLTCNPGGVGHAWVKRLFIDRDFRAGEHAEDYCFIPARVYDNRALMESDPAYLDALRSLPDSLKRAWLEGSWDVFEGQYFTEFSEEVHVCDPFEIPDGWQRFAALDYGFDMLAVLWFAASPDGRLYVYREFCRSGLTLSAAASAVVSAGGTDMIDYIAASPDLWNRRQDSGLSGFAIMSENPLLPPLIKADNRRIIGWRTVREFLSCGQSASLPDGRPMSDGALDRSLVKTEGTQGQKMAELRDSFSDGCGDRQGTAPSDGRPRLQIFRGCTNLIRSLPALCHDRLRPEDVSGSPHEITHSPEALRYGLLSWIGPVSEREDEFSPYRAFMGREGERSLAEY